MKTKRWLQQVIGSFSLSGLLYFFLLKIQGKELITSGSCHACGQCCRSISLHDGKRWLRRKEEFARLIDEQPEFARFVIHDVDAQGFLVFHCTLLTEKGLCGDYENRLPLCCNFPEKTLQFCGGALPSGCGYYFQEVIPFAKVLQKAQRKQMSQQGEQ